MMEEGIWEINTARCMYNNVHKNTFYGEHIL
jgi:hypothetical protein